MAQQAESSIPRVGKRKWGYDAEQVDGFLEHAHLLYDGEGVQLTQRDIQKAAFKLTRGGYDIAQVDAALVRLERAVVDKQTTWEISRHGRVTWKAQTEDLYRRIASHASRAELTRFSDGKKGEPSYDRKQVDRLTDGIVGKCAAELGIDAAGTSDARDLDKITAEYVTNVVFTQRKGKKGYSERQVDYFLGACIQLLSRIESYERLADEVAPQDAEEPVSAPDPVTTVVPPLFSEELQPQHDVAEPVETPHSFAPGGAAESFEELSQAEQSLFTPKASVGQPERHPGSGQFDGHVQPEPYAQPERPVQPAEPDGRAAGVAASQPAAESAESTQPIQSAQPTQSVQPAQGDQSSSNPVSASTSLASLAHMVEATSQDMPVLDIPSLPQVPNLDAPSPFVSSSLPPSFKPAGQDSAGTTTPKPAGSSADDEAKQE